MAKQHNKGFTLIEVMLSITLLAMIALFMLPISVQSLRFSKWNNIKLTAMNLAYSQVEYLKAEAAKDYDKLGIDSLGYSPKGIIKEDLYMNELGTNPITIEGIQYKFLTSIYWESARASNGEFVANAMKKADVIVKAKDPFSGIEKEYSVIGTLISDEGERTPTDNVPLKVIVIKGEDFNNPVKNVKVVVNNIDDKLVNWGMTDELGVVLFSELEKDTTYRVLPEKWDRGDMIGRPNGIAGSFPNQSYIYYKEAKVESLTNPTEVVLHVDFHGYISLKSDLEETIFNEILENSKLTLKPYYTAYDENNVNLELETKLNSLGNLKLWRIWKYTHEIKCGSNTYYFLDKETNEQWDGTFEYIEEKPTIKELYLGFGVNEGKKATVTHINGKIYRIEIEFTSEIDDDCLKQIQFLIKTKNDEEINEQFKSIKKSDINRNKIEIIVETTGQISAPGQETKLYIVNPEELKDINGIKIIQNEVYFELSSKKD